MSFHFIQFLGNEAHFTSLINFQAFNENAPECLTLVHYTDVAESKDIVLMVGEFDGNSLVSHDQQFKKLLPHLLHLLLNTYLAFYILTYVLTYLLDL